MLCGNAADIHFADDNSQLSEPDSEDEHWLSERGIFECIIMYNSRTL